jgi:hypothetical protein
MPLPAPLDLKAWFDADVESYLGIAPTSVSPQPVHVLNGFFHSSLTGRRAWRTAADLVAPRHGQFKLSASELRERTTIGLPASDHELARVRRAADGLIRTDRAVFAGNASFQLAHLGLVSSDTTHFKLGSLASRLALDSAGARDELQGLMHRLAQPQTNPHWAIQAVLAEPGVADDWEIEAPATVDWWGTDPACAQLARDLGDVLRRALTLAGGTADSLLGLQTLAVTATWCGLVSFAQVPSLLLGRGPLPLLVEAGVPGALPTLRDSSARAFETVLQRFWAWLAERLVVGVRDVFDGRAPSVEDAHAFLRECRPYALSGGSRKSQERTPEIFDLWMKHDDDTFRALGLALQDGLIASMGDKPQKWFSAVGRHCGFAGPRRGHPARFRVEVAFAPALVLAGMSDDDGCSVPLAEWRQRLVSRFGIHFGADAVARAMVPRASEEDLEANVTSLAQLLSSLGLARRYSDGVTEVLNPLHLWRRS